MFLNSLNRSSSNVRTHSYTLTHNGNNIKNDSHKYNKIILNFLFSH